MCHFFTLEKSLAPRKIFLGPRVCTFFMAIWRYGVLGFKHFSQIQNIVVDNEPGPCRGIGVGEGQGKCKWNITQCYSFSSYILWFLTGASRLLNWVLPVCFILKMNYYASIYAALHTLKDACAWVPLFNPLYSDLPTSSKRSRFSEVTSLGPEAKSQHSCWDPVFRALSAHPCLATLQEVLRGDQHREKSLGRKPCVGSLSPSGTVSVMLGKSVGLCYVMEVIIMLHKFMMSINTGKMLDLQWVFITWRLLLIHAT